MLNSLESNVIADSVRKEGNQLVVSSLIAEARAPIGCGLAATLNGVSSTFVRIGGDAFTDAGSFFGCSDPVVLGAWNHVAVSFNDDTGVVLFVNGERADNTTAAVPDGANLGQQACGIDAGASIATLQDNQREWMWGANNLQSPANVARDGTVGAIDELRFRSGAFTQEEARLVYEHVAVPPP